MVARFRRADINAPSNYCMKHEPIACIRICVLSSLSASTCERQICSTLYWGYIMSAMNYCSKCVVSLTRTLTPPNALFCLRFKIQFSCVSLNKHHRRYTHIHTHTYTYTHIYIHTHSHTHTKSCPHRLLKYSNQRVSFATVQPCRCVRVVLPYDYQTITSRYIG
jgi:hypothetical protein